MLTCHMAVSFIALTNTGPLVRQEDAAQDIPTRLDVVSYRALR
jgi:hypothetical protein